MIGTINNAALTGIQNGMDGLQKNASQIASKSTMEGGDRQSLVEPLVELKANVRQASASVKVLQVTDQLIGTLLDIKV